MQLAYQGNQDTGGAALCMTHTILICSIPLLCMVTHAVP